jgi:zinc protease
MQKITFLVVLWLASVIGINAQTDLSKPIPVDPNVKIGKLENGLVYYIRHNKMPENRMEMRLVVNAGSILEDEDQQGLAHFAEHMAFNGTANFTKSALVNFLERSGVRFGPDLNAYTSFDETVYMLQLPTDRQGLVDSGFMVLEDWAHQISFEGEEIDKERGVIREEWRLGLGADDRMLKQYFPVALNGSQYAHRLPIGTLGVIDTASYETLRRFYNDWYRPDLQAVIVVGDIDVALVEKKIHQHFSHIQNPNDARERAVYSVPENKEPLVAIAKDKEATGTSLMISYKHAKMPVVTLEDYRMQIMQSIYSRMIINRLQELNRKPESPFINAFTFYGNFMVRSVDAYSSRAAVKENQIESAIATLVTENERVRQHGFTQPEFERQKTEVISRLERQLKEQDKTNSAGFVREYTNHFLNKAPIPSVESQLNLTNELLQMIELKDINALASKWITDENMVIVITAPDREGLNIPEKETVLRIIAETKSAKTEAYVESFKDEPLLDKELKGSKFISQNTIAAVGVEEHMLANGIKVIIKPTDFKNDEILLTAFGPGGTSIFDDEMAFAASNIARSISVSGIGKFNIVDLGKKLTGQIVSVQPFVEDVRQGFRGSASPKDFETMLQLIYLYFDGARRDPEAFEAFKSQMANQFRFMKSNPQMVFADTLSKLASGNSKRAVLIPSEENMATLKAEVIYDMYDKLFASAKDYTFILTGNIDHAVVLPLLEKYLGSLPTEKESATWIDRTTKFPEGITDAKVHAGTEYKSLVAILFRTDFSWTENDRMETSMLSRAFNIKLRENMREEMGGVYGVGARLNTRQFPSAKLDLTINWGTNPGLVDTLSKIVFYEMQKMIDEGPTADDFAKVKETVIRERETNDKQNNFWNSYLDFNYFNKTEMLNFEDFRKKVEAVTIEDLKRSAQKYFTPDHYIRVALYPELTE